MQRAINHLDQRRLAGAVFTQQRMDFAGGDPQAHVVIRPQRAEHLDDVEPQAGSPVPS